MNPPSEEQSAVVAAIAHANVQVNAVAGSGKTTTILHIAAAYPKLKILCLTYNRHLKDESDEKRKRYNIKNLEICTFHSFCRTYYKMFGYTDSDIELLLHNNTPLQKKKLNHIIILDESQDLKPLYYRLFLKYYKDNKELCSFDPKIAVMGDTRQSIYQFNGTDSRYLDHAALFFDLNEFEWKTLTLSTSYRLTEPMKEVVNKHCIHADRIKSVKRGEPVKYIYYDCFKNEKVLNEVSRFKSIGYANSDILILFPSLSTKVKSPLVKLTNMLSNNGIDIFMASNDRDYNKKELENKLVILTYHRAKGLERPVVLVPCFDANYFKFYNKDADPESCPNELYVALTRASRHLVLFQHHRNDPLPFFAHHDVQTPYLKYYAMKEDKKSEKREDAVIEEYKKNMAVTDMFKYISNDAVASIQRLMQYTTLQRPTHPINMNTLMELEDGTFESISDIIGLGVVINYEYKTTKRVRSFDDEKISYGTRIRAIDTFFSLLVQYDSKTTGFLHRQRQLSKKSRNEWMTQETLDTTFERLKSLKLSRDAQFECPVSYYDPDIEYVIRGMVDCIDDDNRIVYEFKFTQDLMFEHKLQLLLYRHYLIATHGEHLRSYTYILFNIRTGEKLQLNMEEERSDEIVQVLIRSKFFSKHRLNDFDFFNENDLYVRHYGMEFSDDTYKTAALLFGADTTAE